MKMIAPGIWKCRFGRPEKHTPVSMKEEECLIESLNKLPQINKAPADISKINFEVMVILEERR